MHGSYKRHLSYVHTETTAAVMACRVSLWRLLCSWQALHIRRCAGGGRGGGRLVSAQEKSKQPDVGVVRQLRVAEPQQPSALGRTQDDVGAMATLSTGRTRLLALTALSCGCGP